MAKKIRALFVEDREEDVRSLVHALSRDGLELDWARVDSDEAMCEALEAHWDVVLCEHRVPDISPVCALGRLREALLDVPLLIVGGDIRPQDVSALMHAGAKDFIPKGDHERLILVIERELAHAQVRRERREAQASVRHKTDQLRQAQKMESVGRLAGGVAHDFNNLLMIITGYGEMLLTDLTALPEARSRVEEILSAGERAATLTRQLLAFSRKQILVPRVLNLNEVVESVDKMLRRVIGEDIELEVRAQPNLPLVLVDPGQMEQVLLNLAVNARDAMPDGGHLLLETRSFAAGDDGAPHPPCESVEEGAILRVVDTGTGMDAVTREKIFDPFFTTKSRDRGTGLGLSTVMGIVEQSLGKISVESELGVGTTFQICFPKTDAPAGAHSPLELKTTNVRGNETLLVVEDEGRLRHLLVQVLTDKGYDVLHVSNGAEALELMESCGRPIDLLLTDMVMPRMNGRELGQAVRAAYPSTPILYVSGYAEGAIGGEGGLESDSIFLQKPILPGKLLRAVRVLLDRSREAPGSRTTDAS